MDIACKRGEQGKDEGLGSMWLIMAFKMSGSIFDGEDLRLASRSSLIILGTQVLEVRRLMQVCRLIAGSISCGFVHQAST